ncbi:MAG: tetratricopeptide repeat protein, partial [Pyrinomonadaceae bacterium]
MKRMAVALSASVLALTLCLSIAAQNDDVEGLKAQGRALVEKQNFIDALPIYEKLAKLAPKDSEVFRNLGFALLSQAANTRDEASAKQLRVRARDTFILARDLGDTSLMVGGIIDGLPADGSPGAGFSDNAAANKTMEEAEALFTQGKLDDAFKAYQKALALDPRCYLAAVFSGDVMLQSGKFDEAEKWYQRAISIDPYKETAYRYSATPLMKQQKYDQARDRYVEAFIVDPYNKLARSGIVSWAQTTHTGLGHPKIDIPETTTGSDGKPNTTINLSMA